MDAKAHAKAIVKGVVASWFEDGADNVKLSDRSANDIG
jgi:hypothetical protein